MTTKTTTTTMRTEGGDAAEETPEAGNGALARYNSMGNLLTDKDREEFVETLQVRYSLLKKKNKKRKKKEKKKKEKKK